MRERIRIYRPMGGEDGMTAPKWEFVSEVWAEKTKTSAEASEVNAMEVWWAETATMRIRRGATIRRGWRVEWAGEAWTVRLVEDKHDGSLLVTLLMDNT